MTKWMWGVAAALVLAPPAALGDRSVRTLTGELSAEGFRRIELRLPPGSVSIEPSRDGRFRAQLDIRCSIDAFGCERRAQRLTLASSRKGSTLEVRVDGQSVTTLGINIHGRIEVPPDRDLEVDFPAGKLTIDGVRGDLEVGAAVGEVRVVLREVDVRSVRLGVGIGEASLTVAGRGIEGSGWLGQKVRWGDGTGPSRVAVRLGIGDLSVRLD